MASGLTNNQSLVLRPAHRETVFCKTLVVGNSIAAYTATLAILQAGGQVCWVQAGPLNLGKTLAQHQQTQRAESRFSWRQGRRISPWEDATVMSQSQQAFWASWQPQLTIAAANSRSARAQRAVLPAAAPSNPASRDRQFREAIAPYLQNQQLILISQGIPIRVLYTHSRGHRRVHQVVFQETTTHQRFQVHARLVLDATPEARLLADLVEDAGDSLPAELVLTRSQLQTAWRQTARGIFFTDTIAVVMANGEDKRTQPCPLAVPLRSLMLQKTDGFLCVSLPGCTSDLRSLFQQPRAQWALGEAAGQVAARAAQIGGLQALRATDHWPWRLQQTLVRQGIPLFAFDDVDLKDPDFEAIQMVAIADVVRTTRRRDLSFRPETPVTKAVLASALMRLPPPQQQPTPDAAEALQDVTANHWAVDAIQAVIARQLLTLETESHFAPSKVISQRQLGQVLQPLYPADIVPPLSRDNTPARRRHLSRSLYPIINSRLSS
ncbi:MAG: hypothetical protein ACFBSG_19415 [Leptolyngbyaceae cyanobacterium]